MPLLSKIGPEGSGISNTQKKHTHTPAQKNILINLLKPSKGNARANFVQFTTFYQFIIE